MPNPRRRRNEKSFLQNAKCGRIRIDGISTAAYVPAAIADRHFPMTTRRSDSTQTPKHSRQEPMKQSQRGDGGMDAA
jgi:hypothetical protein